MDLLLIIAPVMAVVVVGALAGWFGVVQKSIAAQLTQFVYHIALPALMFDIVSREPLGSLLDWQMWATFGGGTLIFLAIVRFLAAPFFSDDPGERALLSFGAAATNSGFVALPLLHAIYGSKGVPPAAVANLVIAVVVFPLGLIMASRASAAGKALSWTSIAKQVAISPLVWPTALGFAVSGLAISVPAPVTQTLQILSAALTPCALFAIGLSIEPEEIRATLARTAALVTMKLVALPAIVLGIAIVVGVNPFIAVTATICASVPTAKNVYFLAEEYNIAKTSAAALISATTILSIATIPAWLLLLETLFPGAVTKT